MCLHWQTKLNHFHVLNANTPLGSDSSGGAGIEADLKNFTAHKCYGMTCITGLTAQNTQGVRSIFPVTDQTFVQQALDAVFEDVGVDAVKTGMLSLKETVMTVSERLSHYKVKSLVVDPVMISTSGANLINDDAILSYINVLMPLATVITPNIGEAEQILRHLGHETKISSLEDMEQAAITLQKKINCKAVLVKGGHLGLNASLIASDSPEFIIDVLYDGAEIHRFKASYLSSTSTHGTGCTLSAAIASNLASHPEITIQKAVGDAISYVQHAIYSAFPLGSGHGPVNHIYNIQQRQFTPGKFVDYLINHPKVKPLWWNYTNHPFTQQIGNNTLSMDSFIYFLRQDYVYLKHYARCHGLAAYKADDMKTIQEAAVIINQISHEQKMHIEYCKKFGISADQLENEPEGLATYAYSRYILDIGSREDWLSLQVALSPCLLGYGEAAANILKNPATVHGHDKNRYWKWVEDYSGEDFNMAALAGRKILEEHTVKLSHEQIEKLVDIFATATQMECEFWTQALKHQTDV